MRNLREHSDSLSFKHYYLLTMTRERRETEDRERQMSKEYAKQLVSSSHFNIVLLINHPQLELVVKLFRSAFH